MATPIVLDAEEHHHFESGKSTVPDFESVEALSSGVRAELEYSYDGKEEGS